MVRWAFPLKRCSAHPKKLGLLVAVFTLGYICIDRNIFFLDRVSSKLPRDILSVDSKYVGGSAKNADQKVDLYHNGADELHLSDLSKGVTEKEVENMKQTVQYLTLDDIKDGKVESNTKKFDGSSMCPEVEDNPNMKGPIPQAVLLIDNLKESEVASIHPELAPGGQWAPDDCKPRHKVAIIIPYRDRQSHLTRLLYFLIPILKRQKLDFRFIVTEQWGNDLFNKGRIMNAAFRLAERLGTDCVIFHDVDMFPQDDRNPYSCPPSPRHLGAFVSNLGYQLWYKEIVGGALAISMADYRTVNGYSNMYWAWGGEDDDMGKRILSLNYTIERPNPVTGRYSMLKHVKRKRTAPKLIYKLLEIAEQRVATDGLNETDKWNVVKMMQRPLYYHIFVDVGEVPQEWRGNGKDS
ncbi:hypothetical protein PRIPAC_90970 [Pristionchus pacificus]|uniref:Beta-1,4-N-acetylgalactosaminyltransferase n=1 Tax=Pristionchus pacificus TaxID=54126 RepID=A0A2A6BYV9_PRIPA|nr:hypothetical protein PRIPAC_90970 [Pristionchus pacificus]|eukprot:PDM71124.1 hypothetical protein PRIPAC_43507 [Pristionchus pacificus]